MRRTFMNAPPGRTDGLRALYRAVTSLFRMTRSMHCFRSLYARRNVKP